LMTRDLWRISKMVFINKPNALKRSIDWEEIDGSKSI
jgi:hypothetical protein